MDRILPEIKHMIAKCTCDQSMESLRELSLVDQEWHKIARRPLYEHIIIRVVDREVPRKVLWLSDAERVLVHVKRLSIAAEWSSVNSVTATRVPKTIAYSHLRPTLADKDLGDRSIPKFAVHSQGPWPAVIDPLPAAPLQDIDLLIANGEPVELQQAISQHHPACRLFVYSSQSQTARRYGKAGDCASLPQLHAAHITCFEYPDRRNFSEHPDRVLEDIAVRAPHAKRLALQIVAGALLVRRRTITRR
ncbi:hypothetical protein BJX99DRAFT_255265 [Aspergillus californicus]